jgi:secretion/DNA translocation related TadE-like protein
MMLAQFIKLTQKQELEPEEGSVTIVLVASVCALFLVLLIILGVHRNQLEVQRAQTALDLAALAGAYELNNGVDDPCARSAEVLASNQQANLKSTCTIEGWDVRLTLSVPKVFGSTKVSSRAGPEDG